MILGILFALLQFSAQAKTFQNNYLSFEVPDDWHCQLEQPEWTCAPSHQLYAKETLVVITAKRAGPNDHLQAFEQHLRQPRTIPDQKGNPTASQIHHVKQIQMAGLNWIEAVHLSSEVPDFITLYLVTVNQSLAVLLTFSAEKTRAAKYNEVFTNILKTLRWTASRDLLVGTNTQSLPQLPIVTQQPSVSESSQSWRKWLLPTLAGAAVIFLLGILFFRK